MVILIFDFCFLYDRYTHVFFPGQILMKKFVTLGTECAEYLKAARTSEGDLLFYALLVSSAFLCFFIILTFPFLLDALATASARIASLEAELGASRKAFDAATATKASAEKSSKSALAKTKKLEKSLADLNKEHIQQDQAVAERLNKMLALARGKRRAFSPSLFALPILILY
jgi:septal ring factor EnvC (AmiA/AmiB activator)